MLIDMPWLLVDGMWLAYRALHSWRGGWDPSYRWGLFAGMLDQIKMIGSDDRCLSNRVVIFFDGKGSHRQQIFSDYKRKRHDLAEDEMATIAAMHEQIDRIVDRGLPNFGIQVHRRPCLEGDDLIATAVRDLGPAERAIIITSDGDLYQCISPSVGWFDPTKGLFIRNDSDFREMKGVTPRDWSRVKSIAGCPGDGVPGVGGVGEKTAIAYLRGEKITPKRLSAIERGTEVIERNRRLVELPFKGTDFLRLDEPDYPNEDGFKNICRNYELPFDDEGSRLKSWLNWMKGSFSATDMQRRNLRKRIT